jgi:hypothetical protein
MSILRLPPILTLLALLGLPSGASATFIAADYFPLASGNSWEYVENGGVTSTDTVLSGTQNVGGVDTFVLQTAGGAFPGASNNLTNDSDGLRIHGFSDGTDTATLAPPGLFLQADFEVGVAMNSQGDLTIPGAGTFAYTVTATATGPGPVTVPWGTFDAIMLETTLSAAGITETDRVWLVEDLGPVKWVEDVFGSPLTRELVNTSVPEPGTILPLALGLASLCASRRRRRSRRR